MIDVGRMWEQIGDCRRLFVSFSGGRTSALMARLLHQTAPANVETVTVFANTGKEHPRTLEFVDRCDREFGLNVVWVEAVVTPKKGIGTRHKVVTFDTAARRGEPFEAVIQKFGIPNASFPHCTRELKLNPMRSYMRHIGWRSGTYWTAIGIRADEIDRMSASRKQHQLFYPLVKLGVTKDIVRAFWSQEAFDLGIPEHAGNCVTCWKKSHRKLLTIAVEAPQEFEFFDRMEQTYPDAGPGDFDRPRRFFRGNRSTKDILSEAAVRDFSPYVDEMQPDWSWEMDASNGCEDSCEIDFDD